MHDYLYLNKVTKVCMLVLLIIGVALSPAKINASQLAFGPEKTIKMAVASNFYKIAKELCEEFSRINNGGDSVSSVKEEKTGNGASVSCTLVQSSSGKLLSQILHGAPYEIFLSADQERPEFLYNGGIAEQPLVYAVGQIALIANNDKKTSNLNAQQKLDMFRTAPEKLQGIKIAIANPKVAPYGLAANEFLNQFLDQGKRHYTLIIGQSAAQAYQFLKANTVDYAIVPLSYVYNTETPYWKIPDAYHAPIFQSLSILRKNDKVSLLLTFTQSICEPFWINILSKYGYKKSPLCNDGSHTEQ